MGRMNDDQTPPSGGGSPHPPPGAGGGPRLTKEPAGGAGPAWGAPGAGPGPAEPAGLVRSRRYKVVGGVCGGLGRYFDLDPVVFRVPLAVLSFIGGLGLVFYGFAWLVVPREGERENELRRLLSGRVDGAALSAILVALVGRGLFLASLRAGYTSFSLLVAGAVGGAAYWSQRRRRAEAAGAEGAQVDPATAHAVADAPPETQAPPVHSTPSWWRDPLTKDGTPARERGYLWGPDTETPYTAADKEAFRRRTRGRRSYGGPVFVLAQLAALVSGGIALGSRSVADSLVIALACALLVYGVALAVSAFAGRVGGGTIFAVVLTAVGLAAASVLPQDISAEWEQRRWAPVSAAAVHPYYEQGTGRGTLDLTRVRPGEGETVRTRVRLGAGELRVLVPEDVVVRADIEVGAGGYRLPRAPGADPDDASGPGRRGGSQNGDGGGLGVTETRVLRPADGREPQGTLVLDLDVGVGEVVVKRAERPGSADTVVKEGARR
jgi:phage shock protein PspC (stress-responsive transcriptional regulator)